MDMAEGVTKFRLFLSYLGLNLVRIFVLAVTAYAIRKIGIASALLKRIHALYDQIATLNTPRPLAFDRYLDGVAHGAIDRFRVFSRHDTGTARDRSKK